MANEITIKVKVDNQSKAGYDQARKDGKDFADRLGDDLKAEGEKAGQKMGSGVGSSLNRELKALRLPEIDVDANVEDALKKLDEARFAADALAKDNPTVEVKVRSDKAIAEIDKLKAKLTNDMSAAGDSGGDGFIKNLGIKFKAIAGTLTPGLIEAGVGAAPLLAAVIGGAVVGGVGLGGIAGGFALAARDPNVQLAVLDLRDNVMTTLQDAAEPFSKVAIDSVAKVQGAFNNLNFKNIFANLAPQTAPVINGVIKLVSELGDAIEYISERSGPVLKAIGDGIGNMGETISNGLKMISNNSDENANALKELFAVIDAGITVAFTFLEVATKIYGVLYNIGYGVGYATGEVLKFFGVQEQATGGQLKFAKAAEEAAGGNDELTTSAEVAKRALEQQDDAIHQVADSLKAAADPAFAFIDAQKDLNDKQEAYNKAVKKGGENSKGARDAQLDLQKAMVNYVSAAANATNGTGHLTNEQKNLLRSAGTSKKGIQDLDTALYNAWKQANKLDGFEVDVTYKTTFKTYGRPISGAIDPSTFYHGLAHGGVAGAANGATSSGLTWAGERGPELLDLPPGTMVHTAGDSQRKAAGPDGYGWNGAPIVVQLIVDGKMLAEQVVDPMRDLVQSQGRGSVQRLLGQPGVA